MTWLLLTPVAWSSSFGICGAFYTTTNIECCMHRFLCKPVDSCAGGHFMIFCLWFQFSIYFNLINFVPFSSDSYAYFVMLLYFVVWFDSFSVSQSGFIPVDNISFLAFRLRWLSLISNTCRHPCFVRPLTVIIQHGLWLFSLCRAYRRSLLSTSSIQVIK